MDSDLSPEEKAQQELMLKSVADSPLFDLPPELRNKIYRYALVRNRELPITKSRGIPEAPLLSVSKLVRSETYELFYLENKFKCVVHNYDPTSLMLLDRRWSALARIPGTTLGDTIDVDIHWRGKRNWKNLVTWLHFAHHASCCGINARPHQGTEESLISGLFRMVMNGPGMTSSALDFLLESMRPTFVKIHKDWGKD